MATVLAEEDFQRLQNQLLDLRTKNYTLEEKCSKYFNELRHVHQNFEDLKHELGRAQRTIQRSKNARDLEQILNENVRLQSKLQSQEDEFRLQNETLMQEVISLTSMNEKLQKDLEVSKVAKCSSSDEAQVDLLRLEAENNALKKLLQQTKVVDLDGENAEAYAPANELDENAEYKLKMETEVEEKILLRMKIQELQKLHQETVWQLQNANEKLSEKLKKKQDIILQLNDEKEMEIKKLKEQMQVNNPAMKNVMHPHPFPDLVSSSELNSDVFSSSEATVELLDGEKAAFGCPMNETKINLREYDIKLQNLGCRLEEYEATTKKLEEEKLVLKEENSTLEKENNLLNEAKFDLESAVLEKSNLAEERKSLMDKMNLHLIETNTKHSKEIENLTQQLSQEQDALQKLFNKEKETRIELLEAQNELQCLRKEVEQLKSEHQVSCKELEITLKTVEEEKKVSEERLSEQQELHQYALDKLEAKVKACEEDANIQIAVAVAERSEFEEKVTILQQEIKDLLDEKKIIEKKNASLAKDLKRQLLTERKRVEKIQERLQELLSEQNRSVDEILPSANSDKAKGDTSSVSSWSYVSAEAAEREENHENPSHSDGSSCERDLPSSHSPSTLENETTNLLAKITHLQQRNWMLEEKVNHLEMSNEALVDDLLKKTAIIQYYCMEGRSNTHAAGAQDKLTIKRIVDFIKDKGDENLREINRKMQRMLEETLTKNMHLQKHVETLSNEVTHLTKMTDIDQNLQSTVFVEKD